MIEVYELHHALHRLSPEGVWVALPGVHDGLHRLPVHPAPDLLEQAESGADAGQPLRTPGLLVVHIEAHSFCCFQERHSVLIAAVDQRPELRPGGQAGGRARLLGEQQRLIALGQAVEHLAADGQVPPTIEQFPGGDGVLAIEHIVAAVPAAHLRLVGDALIELGGDPADPVLVQFTLISSAGYLQLCAVDGKLPAKKVLAVHSVRPPSMSAIYCFIFCMIWMSSCL